MKDCCPEVKNLSAAAVNEIKKLTGAEEILHMIVVDTKGNLIPLTREGVTVKHHEMSDEKPFSHAMTSIQPAVFGTYKGSCCAWIKWGNQWICYEYPC